MATSSLAKKLLNVIEFASVTGHSSVQMPKRYYHVSASELSKKLGREGFGCVRNTRRIEAKTLLSSAPVLEGKYLGFDVGRTHKAGKKVKVQRGPADPGLFIIWLGWLKLPKFPPCNLQNHRIYRRQVKAVS